jgi:uncharacterized protein with ParB-like and HNH nuclease domain
LYDDLSDNDPGHFVGSIICINDNQVHIPGNDIVFELIDGQQRLTTLSLLLAAVHYRLNELLEEEEVEGRLDEEEVDDFKARRRSISKQLIKHKRTNSNYRDGFKDGKRTAFFRVQPSTQNSNMDDYKYILYDAGVLSDEPTKPPYIGNRLMYKAYEYFYDRLPEDIEKLEDMIRKINQIILVHISVDNHSNAFKLFETLNNRGIRLTAVDIIKNKMLAEMERQRNVSVDDAYEQWQELLENIPEGYHDRFLRQFYNAFKHRNDILVKKHPGKATVSALIAIYETLINKNPEKIFDELTDKAKIYSRLSSPNGNTSLGNVLIDLNRVGAVTSYTLLLYLLSLNSKHFKEQDLISSIVELLQKYYLRRNVTDVPGTRDLDQIQIDVVNECVKAIKAGKKLSYPLIMNALFKGKGQPASLSEFKKNVEDNFFEYNAWMTRYLLIKIDEQAHSREYKPDFWSRNEKGQYVWTVEHIFPRGINIPKPWVDMIANGERERAAEIQEEWVHSFGNLTLSGYNSRLSNQSFERKQKKSEMTALGHKIHIGYKNGLYLNNLKFKMNGLSYNLARINKWTADAIESRNEAMVKKICKLYAFENEENEFKELF